MEVVGTIAMLGAPTAVAAALSWKLGWSRYFVILFAVGIAWGIALGAILAVVGDAEPHPLIMFVVLATYLTFFSIAAGLVLGGIGRALAGLRDRQRAKRASAVPGP